MAIKATKTHTKNSSVDVALKKIDELVDAYASLKASVDALVAKLNADAGVTDVNYANAAKAAPAKTDKSFQK